MFKLPNGKKIDENMVELAMQDSDLENYHFLDTETGEIIFISNYSDSDEAIENRLEEMEDSRYIAIKRIPSEEQYRWMKDFIDDIVAKEDEQTAEKLSMAIQGKEVFRRFKDVLYTIGDGWIDGWHQWENDSLYEAMKEWFENLPMRITEEFDFSDDCKSCEELAKKEPS
ncbi:MAG TPA: UPF0158 family protein [Patescibacteria group bacterium]|nr:UPF0158 family protein [Patescibacteria group bacterium]